MNVQHRYGHPTTTRQNDHTRWEAPAPDRLTWADWLLILAIAGALTCAACGVTVWA